MSRAFCRKCGKQIDFVKTSAGKFMPVEPHIVYVYNNPDGNMTVLTKNGKIIHAIPAYATDHGAIIAYVPHWQRCAGADEIHREQKKIPEKSRSVTFVRKPERTEEHPQDKQMTLF